MTTTAALYSTKSVNELAMYCSGYDYVFGYATIDPLPVWRDWSLINELLIN